MKYIISLIFACCTAFNILCSQQILTEQVEDFADFPVSWFGKYAGELEIFTGEGLKQKLPMELHILPIDTSDNVTWTIIYGADKEAGKRAYELVAVDVEKGIYKIDEKNSIAMEAYLLGNGLYQRFEVMGTMLMSITELISANEISWTIISGKNKAISETGNQIVEGEEIPIVKGFALVNAQKAILRRVE